MQTNLQIKYLKKQYLTKKHVFRELETPVIEEIYSTIDRLARFQI